MIIFNPAAGRAFYNPAKPVEAVANALRAHVPEVEMMPTTLDRRAEAMALEALGKGCDLIAPLGGDGTINEALQAVAEADAALLPLPGGTANVLALETGIGLDPVKAASALPSLEERAVTLGAVEFPKTSQRRLFLLMCGAGVDANAVYQLSSGLKRRVGVLAYVWSGFKQMLHPLKTITVRLGEEEWTGALAVISKSKLYGGGLMMTPDAHLLADHFDVICFRSQSALEYPAYLAAVLTRTMDRLQGVVRRQFDVVNVAGEEAENVYVQVDGELAGSLPIRVRLGPERLRLLAPPGYWAQVEQHG